MINQQLVKYNKIFRNTLVYSSESEINMVPHYIRVPELNPYHSLIGCYANKVRNRMGGPTKLRCEVN